MIISYCISIITSWEKLVPPSALRRVSRPSVGFAYVHFALLSLTLIRPILLPGCLSAYSAARSCSREALQVRLVGWSVARRLRPAAGATMTTVARGLRVAPPLRGALPWSMLTPLPSRRASYRYPYLNSRRTRLIKLHAPARQACVTRAGLKSDKWASTHVQPCVYFERAIARVLSSPTVVYCAAQVPFLRNAITVWANSLPANCRSTAQCR